MTLPFKKLLVANRGEIACRVLRTAERLGLRTVAVFSDADVGSPHVALADEAVRIGPAPVKESYLNVPALLAALADTGADAVHPGYGLLSENAEFASAVTAAGATFVGPSPEAMRLVGDKIRARQSARAVGLLPPPGSDGPVDPADAERLRLEAERIGFPVLVKAAGGGGGIGMQIARDASELERAAKSCSERGRAAFLDARVYLERYLERPRHIELQVLRDAHGTAVILGERECSVQRRYQKIIEESPSPAAFLAGAEGKARRAELTARALELVAAVEYTGAGTIELVADSRGDFYFLEVNARIQVEHPVTELVTGVDIVAEQLAIAAGERLAPAVQGAEPRGHAVEARLYAENPSMGFVPQPGKLVRFRLPEGLPGVRIDAGYVEGGEVTPHYDPLIAKIIGHGGTRAEAIARLDAALAATDVELVGARGPRQTNRDFLRAVLQTPEFRAGDYDTSLAERLAKTQKSG
ncbi:MAG TPA: biotin carboxylase N-terminal domain-containing protein [Polyangiaceae bacterium]|nr:biotin carboxylase N-terminal domain-containing protein [Polyangiaceae bacterium]